MSLLNSRKCLLSYKTLDMKNVNTHYKKGKICQNMRHFKYKDKHYLLVLLLFFQVVVQEFLKKKKKKSGCSSLSEFLEY